MRACNNRMAADIIARDKPTMKNVYYEDIWGKWTKEPYVKSEWLITFTALNHYAVDINKGQKSRLYLAHTYNKHAYPYDEHMPHTEGMVWELLPWPTLIK